MIASCQPLMVLTLPSLREIETELAGCEFAHPARAMQRDVDRFALSLSILLFPQRRAAGKPLA